MPSPSVNPGPAAAPTHEQKVGQATAAYQAERKTLDDMLAAGSGADADALHAQHYAVAAAEQVMADAKQAAFAAKASEKGKV